MLEKVLGFNVVIAAILITALAMSIALAALIARALLYRYHRMTATRAPA